MSVLIVIFVIMLVVFSISLLALIDNVSYHVFFAIYRRYFVSTRMCKEVLVLVR